MAIRTIKSKDITDEEKRMNAKALANYKGLTLVNKFIKYDVNGNGIYSIQALAYDTIQDLVLNVTNLTTKVLACTYSVRYDNVNNAIKGYDTDVEYFANALKKQGFKVKSYRV